MLSACFWLSSAPTELLRTCSQLLKGGLPAPAKSLAEALIKADASACEGLLRSDAVRKALASTLNKEITDSSAQELGQALQSVIQKEVDSVKAAAGPLAKSFGGKKIPTFNEAASALLKDKAASEILKRDILLWNVVSTAHEKQMKQPPQDLIAERLALAASCAGDCGAFAMSVHILENLERYFEWEASLPSNQPQAADKLRTSLDAFKKEQITELVVRQVLCGALPSMVAASIASTAVSSSKGNLKDIAKKVREILVTRAAEDAAKAVLPRYAAPPEKKEGKAGKKEAKGGADASADAGKKADTGKKVGATAGTGAMIAGYNGTTGEELQWHMVQYLMRPGTALSVATPGSAPKAPTSSGPGKKSSGGGSIAKPQGFSGLWGADLPPGHTPYSWKHEQQHGVRTPCPWDREGDKLPDGHTDYSWEAVQGGSFSASSKPAPPKSGKPKGGQPAAKVAPKAAPQGNAAGAPPAGSSEEALCKLDLRCGKILSIEAAPGSDKLYLLKVDIGDAEPRQVLTGLQKHYKADQLKDRSVVVYCNIKPGKMMGLESQAMVLAATKDKGADNEICKVLDPPAGVTAGTRVKCGSYEIGSLSDTISVKNISKVWTQVMPDLKTDDKCQASFQGQTLTLDGKAVTTEKLTGVPIS